MENLRRMQQAYKQVDSQRVRKSQHDYHQAIKNDNSFRSLTRNKSSNIQQSRSSNNLGLEKPYTRNNQIVRDYSAFGGVSRNNNQLNFSKSNPFLLSAINKSPQNLTSNDLIKLSTKSVYDNLKYTGYRFDTVKNIAEIIELNGTFRKKIPSANSEIFNHLDDSKKSKSRSPWQRMMDKTPKNEKLSISISKKRENEINNGKRVLFPDEYVRITML